MFEILKHAFGFCGDGHPNIFNLLYLTPLFFYKNIIFYLKSFLNNYLKYFLTKLNLFRKLL